jgi:hypothetical protein
MSWIWEFVKENHAAISAASAALGVLVALAGVIVAIGYVVLTGRLWQAAKAQADLTKGIAEETKRQAETSQSMFEASHRPYLEVTLPNAVFVRPDWYSIKLHVANRGSTPAVDLAWAVRVSKKGVSVVDRRSGADRVVFPNQARVFHCQAGTQPIQAVGEALLKLVDEPVSLDVRVDYVGPSGRRYFTKMAADGNNDHWTITAHEIGWDNQVAAEPGSYRLGGE